MFYSCEKFYEFNANSKLEFIISIISVYPLCSDKKVLDIWL